MAFSVSEGQLNLGDGIYYDERFRDVLETHLTLLKRSNIRTELIAADLVYQYEGNFLGLLRHKGVAVEHHWLYLRVNGFTNPVAFGRVLNHNQSRGIVFTLIHPDMNFVEQIKGLFLTAKK